MDVEVKPTELISVKSIKDSDYILISYLRFSYKVLASDFFNYVKNYISNSSGKPKLTFEIPRTVFVPGKCSFSNRTPSIVSTADPI